MLKKLKFIYILYVFFFFCKWFDCKYENHIILAVYVAFYGSYLNLVSIFYKSNNEIIQWRNLGCFNCDSIDVKSTQFTQLLRNDFYRCNCKLRRHRFSINYNAYCHKSWSTADCCILAWKPNYRVIYQSIFNAKDAFSPLLWQKRDTRSFLFWL